MRTFSVEFARQIHFQAVFVDLTEADGTEQGKVAHIRRAAGAVHAAQIDEIERAARED